MTIHLINDDTYRAWHRIDERQNAWKKAQITTENMYSTLILARMRKRGLPRQFRRSSLPQYTLTSLVRAIRRTDN